MIEYCTVDKTNWERGPWDGEPDKAQWVDEATGSPCLMVRNRMGALCGYVGVQPGHIAFGAGYDDLYEISVHGGLTYAAGCSHADREIGMPRMVNYAQRKLLKNAYEDMDQTTLVYVYTQALDGRFVCLGQAVGYGVSLGTQFTAPTTPEMPGVSERGIYARPQPEPNGLYMPESGAATIVNLVDPATGKARTALVEPSVVTTPNKLPATAVAVACPGDVDPSKVSDAKETSVVAQR